MNKKPNLIILSIATLLLPFLFAYVLESLIFIDGYIVYIVSSVQIMFLLFLFTKRVRQD